MQGKRCCCAIRLCLVCALREHCALHCAELVNKLQRHPSSGRDDIKVLLRVLRDEIGRAYFKRYAPCKQSLRSCCGYCCGSRCCTAGRMHVVLHARSVSCSWSFC